MFKKSFIAIGVAARETLTGWRLLGVSSLLYAALLISVLLFFTTKEATAPELAFTVLLAVVAPILLFLIVATAVAWYTSTEPETAGALFRRVAADFLKVVVVSIPLILIAVGVVYVIGRVQSHYPVTVSDATRRALTPAAHPSGPTPARAPVMPLHWPSILFTTLRILLLWIALPLAALHLWLTVGRDGLLTTVRRLARVLARAFEPQSVFIYVIGLILFGMMPYFLIFTRTPVKNGWAELIIFGLRLLLAFVLTLWGWLITVGALARTTAIGAEPR